MNLQEVTREFVKFRTELLVSSLRRLGIGTENIPQPARERRQKACHNREEVGPSTTAPPPPPPQSNWQWLFTRLDDIEYRLGQMDTRLEIIEYHLGIPPPHNGD